MEACRNPVPPFSIRSATSANDWNRWKRDLELYFAAENVTSHAIKKAKLLFYGGREIIDLFDSLTVSAVLPQGENVYTQAVRVLTEQINPTHNDLYERCMLRRLKQTKDESFAQFITRVRQQAKKCNLVAETLTADNYILEQVVDGCFSDEIRKELMKKGLQDLAEAEKQANAIEAINAQCKAVQLPVDSTVPENADSVRRAIVTKNRRFKPSTSTNESGNPEQKTTRCYRCSSEKHLANDENCPAKKFTCSKCNKVGHFAKCCRSPNFATDSSISNPATTAKSDKAVIKVVCTSDDDGDPIFCIPTDDVSSSPSRAEEIVDCEVGGVVIPMYIDSGYKWSIMGLKSWRKLENQGVRHFGFNYNPEVRTFDASLSLQYDVLFSVSCEIRCNNLSIVTNIIVVRERFAVILGSTDAKALHLLIVGLNAVSKNSTTIPVPEEAVQTINSGSSLLSKLKNFQLELPIDQTITPVVQPFRRVPYALRAPILKELTELKNLDVIEPVTGPSRWVSPMVPAPKGEKGIRICVDMRLANAAILDEKHPLPTIEDLLPLLKDAVLFSKIDLKMAYHQIELHPNSREVTTFSTPFGLFRYKRLMMGLKCAPEQFQKIMENLLRTCDGVFIYLDDILVFGRSKEEHDQNLTNLLRRIQELGLTLSTEKCVYRQPEITFLGHLLGVGSIKPTLNKVKAIQDFRPPSSATELRSFLGLVTYVGKSIPNLSTLLDPLQKTARLKIFQWTAADSAIFEEIKNLLSAETTLGFFDPDLRTIVMADASPVGLGAVLLQEKGASLRTICFVNRSLSPVERRYSQTEKEALALVFAVERLKYYLVGREFDLVTDHKPLECIFSPRSKPCARIERWVLRLQGFKFRVIYRAGKNNIADPLSRLLPDNASIMTENDIYEKNLVMFINELTPRALVLADILREIELDPELKQLRDELLADQLPSSKPFLYIKDELGVVDGILVRGSRLIIPSSLRDQTLQNAHEGHPGITKMKARLRSKVWWPNIDLQAERFVKSCDACQKVGKSIIQEEIHRRQMPDGPWQDLAIDFKDLPDGSYLCVVVDYFSRYIEVKVLKSITTKTTCDFLDEIFTRHGFPYSITSDQGSQFTSADFASYCAENGIQHYTTFAYWPQANGEVERQNRSLQKIIQISQLKKSDWRKELLQYLLMYRSTAHSVTGRSPTELLFNRKIRDKLPTLKEREERLEVRNKDALNKAKSLKPGSVPLKEISVGDEVLLKRPFKTRKADSKFEEETGVVTAVDGPSIAVETPTKKVIRHKNQLELYTRRKPTEAETSSDSATPEAVSEPAAAPTDTDEIPELRRSSRSARAPAHLNDFV